jgi:TRAP-type C4-dicarboxylate transport system permease small subunit
MAGRKLYLDNLKVMLIAAIIAIHGVLGYVGMDQWWAYADVQEVTLAEVTEIILIVAALPFGLFLIALLFLVSGLLSPQSLERKGPGRYALDRILRLGVPFAVFVLVLQPLVLYALLHPLGAAPGSYLQEFLGSEQQLDTGPLWFVGVLLIFSLGYAGWSLTQQRSRGRRQPREIRARHLMLLALVVAPTTFLVRLVYPFGTESGFSDLNLWEWPACIALFGLGVLASGQGWLIAVPDPLRRRCRTVTVAAIAAFAAFLYSAGAMGLDEQHLWGGLHWPALGFASFEAILNVFGPVPAGRLRQRHRMRASTRIRLMSSHDRANEPATPPTATMSAFASAGMDSGRSATASPMRMMSWRMNAP